MTSTIEIQFQQVTQTDNECRITVSNGTFELNSSQFLSFKGSMPFASLTLSSGSIVINNNASGAVLDGEITIPVTPAADGDPIITVTSFQGTAILSWLTASGPQSQPLAPNNPITLSGFIG